MATARIRPRDRDLHRLDFMRDDAAMEKLMEAMLKHSEDRFSWLVPGSVWQLRGDELSQHTQSMSTHVLPTGWVWWPQLVAIESVEPESWGDIGPKVCFKFPSGETLTSHSFDSLYEIYRPTSWERLANSEHS